MSLGLQLVLAKTSRALSYCECCVAARGLNDRRATPAPARPITRSDECVPSLTDGDANQ
jgi:hypothetical protein